METVEILLRFVSGQLSLLPSAERKMSTGQSAVTLCGWGVKAGMVHSTCGQTCRWQLGGELLMIKRYTNRHFTSLCAAAGLWSRSYGSTYCRTWALQSITILLYLWSQAMHWVYKNWNQQCPMNLDSAELFSQNFKFLDLIFNVMLLQY